MKHVGMNASCIVRLKITHIVETVVFQTTYTKDGKMEDIATTQHHLNHHIQTMISEPFTIGSIRSGNLFHNTYPCEYSTNVSHTHNTRRNNQQMPQKARPITFEGNSLALVMIEQTIMQEALTSIETFDGTKSNLNLGKKLSK